MKKINLILSVFLFIISVFFVPITVDAKKYDYINVDSSIITKQFDKSNEDINETKEEISECQSVFGDVNDENSVAWLLQKLLDYIKILGPTIAIVMGSVDFAKAIISSDEENMKKTQKRFMNRLIAAILLFFIPILVSLLLGFFGITTNNATCGLN